MVSTLVLLMFLSILQVAFAMHTRNILQDAASQGARYGALFDRTAAEGEERTQELISYALPQSYQTEISSTVTNWHGVEALQVTVTAPIPLIGPIGIPGQWEVTGHAVLQS